jgi:hypothetical protein
MAFWNNRKDHKPWRLRQYGSNLPPLPGQKPPPPPGPPDRMVENTLGETKESVRDGEDWRTYMAGFTHGLAVARPNVRSQAADAALSRQVACTDVLGLGCSERNC